MTKNEISLLDVIRRIQPVAEALWKSNPSGDPQRLLEDVTTVTALSIATAAIATGTDVAHVRGVMDKTLDRLMPAVEPMVASSLFDVLQKESKNSTVH